LASLRTSDSVFCSLTPEVRYIIYDHLEPDFLDTFRELNKELWNECAEYVLGSTKEWFIFNMRNFSGIYLRGEGALLRVFADGDLFMDANTGTGACVYQSELEYGKPFDRQQISLPFDSRFFQYVCQLFLEDSCLLALANALGGTLKVENFRFLQIAFPRLERIRCCCITVEVKYKKEDDFPVFVPKSAAESKSSHDDLGCIYYGPGKVEDQGEGLLKLPHIRGILLAFNAARLSFNPLYSHNASNNSYTRRMMILNSLRDIMRSDKNHQQRLEEELEDSCCIPLHFQLQPKGRSMDWPSSQILWNIIDPPLVFERSRSVFPQLRESDMIRDHFQLHEANGIYYWRTQGGSKRSIPSREDDLCAIAYTY
jgi:hypothetical protein